MRVATRSDIKLVSQAVHNAWDISDDQRKEIVDSLMDCVRTKDPKLMPKAIELLTKLDEVNAKREAVQSRELNSENGDQRLQLLELAQRVPASELARIASENGIVVDATAAQRRADASAGADGEKAGERT